MAAEAVLLDDGFHPVGALRGADLGVLRGPCVVEARLGEVAV